MKRLLINLSRLAHRRCALTAASVVLAAIPTFGHAFAVQDVQNLEIEARAKVSKLLAKKELAGLGYVVVYRGKPVLMSAQGSACKNLSAPLKFTLDTPVQLGNLSILAHRLLALRARRAGWFNPEQDLKSVLPQLKFTGPAAPQLSMDSLLYGNSGIANGNFRDQWSAGGKLAGVEPNATLWLNRAAGLISENSPQAEEVLALAFEQLHRKTSSAASGKTGYAALLRDELVALEAKSLAHGFTADTACGHIDGKALPKVLPLYAKAFGMQASLRDVAKLIAAASQEPRFFQLNPNPPPLDFADSKNGRSTLFEINRSLRAGVGPVAALDDYRLGHRANLRIYPSHELSVLSFFNGEPDYKDAREFNSWLSDAFLLAIADIKPRDKDFPDPEPQSALPLGFEPAPVAGAYVTPMGLVQPKGNGERFDFEVGGFNLRAEKRSDGWYQLRYRLLGLIPLNLSVIEKVLIAPVRAQRDARLVPLVVFRIGETTGLFGSELKRAESAVPAALPAEQLAWLGSYELSNPDKNTESAKVSNIKVVSGANGLQLEASFGGFMKVETVQPLSRFDANTTYLSGIGPLLGEPIYRDPNSGALSFLGYTLTRRGK